MRSDFRWSKTLIVLIGLFLVVQLTTLSPLWNHLQSHVSSFRTVLKPSSSTSNSVTRLPSDYLNLSPDEERCERVFGPSHLEYLASHQLPYCEPGSNSGLQCFRINRTAEVWTSDSLCIAQGALLDGNREKELSLQCRLRNFTAEALAGNEEVAGVLNIEDMPSFYYWTGIMEQLKTWKINGNDDSGCGKDSGDKNWILLTRRETNLNIWHKLVELWQASISLDVIRMATNPTTGGPYLTPQEEASVQVVFEDDRDEPLNDWWTIVSGNPPIRKSQLSPGCYKNVILPLVGSSSPYWSLLGRPYTGAKVCKDTFLADAFLRRIYRYLRIEPPGPTVRDPVITIIDRKGTRKIFNIERYVENLRQKYPNLKINLVDFGTLTLREQVLVAQGTDILVGHHGAGMTHVLFMPEQSAVIEIFPPTFGLAGFRHLSKMRQHSYFAVNSIWVGDWEKETGTGSGTEHPPWDESKWQNSEWVYIRERDFQSLVDAALWSIDYKSVGTASPP
jgi:EGF domain-specific O-GlcNAc transferase